MKSAALGGEHAVGTGHDADRIAEIGAVERAQAERVPGVVRRRELGQHRDAEAFRHHLDQRADPRHLELHDEADTRRLARPLEQPPDAGVAIERDDRHVVEIVEGDPILAGEGVVRRADDAAAVGGERREVEIGMRLPIAGDAEIGAEREHHLLDRGGIAVMDADHHLGVADDEARQGRRDDMRGDALGTGDRDAAEPAVGDLAHAADGALEILDEALGGGQQQGAGARQLDAARRAVEQRRAEFRFDLADRHRQRRLGDPEIARGLGEAERARHHDERLQLRDGEGQSGHL